MKAVQFLEHGSPDVLIWMDVPDPAFEQNSVLVRIQVAAMNHLDIWVRRGIPGVPRPMIPGSDGAGIIEAVGEKVTTLNIGDRVVIQPLISCGACDACLSGEENLCRDFGIIGETTPGTNCELLAIPAQYVYPIPGNMEFTTAAAFPLVGETAWTMLVKRANIQANEWVFIWGASSGIGHVGIQIAKYHKCRVITTAGSDEKEDLALKMGADYVLNYNRDDIVGSVRDITDGKGVDVVFEHVGQKTWGTSTRILAFGGRIVTCGATTGPKVEIDLRHLFMKQQSILGSTMGSVASFEAVFDLVLRGVIKPHIDRIFPMAEIQAAHRYLESGQQFGKVLLLP